MAVSTINTSRAVTYAGAVLQVVSTAKTDTFTTTSNTLTSVTGLTATITPTSASSKILVLVTMSVGTTYGSTAIMTGLLRGSTNLLLGDAAGTRKQAFMTQTDSNNNFQLCISMAYLDSPASTSQLTYAASIACQEGNSTTVCVNRSGADPDGTYASRTASTITVMEIAA